MYFKFSVLCLLSQAYTDLAFVTPGLTSGSGRLADIALNNGAKPLTKWAGEGKAMNLGRGNNAAGRQSQGRIESLKLSMTAGASCVCSRIQGAQSTQPLEIQNFGSARFTLRDERGRRIVWVDLRHTTCPSNPGISGFRTQRLTCLYGGSMASSALSEQTSAFCLSPSIISVPLCAFEN